MKIFYGVEHLPLFPNTIISIGSFDGLHQGHQIILSNLVKYAQKHKGTSILITFDPHPRKLLYPQQSLKLLSSFEDRLELMEQIGLDVIVVVPFTKDFAALSAANYIENFLIKKFQPKTIIIGYDHKFGHDRSGDIKMLEQWALKAHFQLIEIPEHQISDAAISSTKIRQALEKGQVSQAHNMLGRPYRLSGKVIKGQQLGRTLGYPTANIEVSNTDLLIPALGIYIVQAIIQNKKYPAMMSIGYNPTTSQDQRLKLEVHLLDFNQDLYGQSLQIDFLEFIRKEAFFENLEQLKLQIQEDEKLSREWFTAHNSI